jgi:predicted phage-related endonuclease
MSVDLVLRRNRIGGSEVAPIMDADDFGRTGFSIWFEKKFGGDPGPPPDWQVHGKLLERGILDIYTYDTGRKVEYHDRTILDPARAYMAATPDGFCINERRGVDAKRVLWHQGKLYGETANEIPMRVVMQCWWYMAAFDYDLWDVCALVGDEVRIYTIERDREAERAMLDYIARWHAKYILGDDIPPMGRTREAAAYLQRMFPNDNRPSVRAADAAEIELLNSYVQLRLAEKRMKGERTEMETAIKAAIKDCEGLRWEEGTFTWRRTKDSEETNWEALAHGLLVKHVPDPEELKTLLSIHTNTKPGYRKIRIDHPLLRKGAEEREEAAA